jgi:2,3-dihydroxy-p-cumate/2,3-dihydroxybenzoate 3,4-dioxygenase
MIQHVLVFRFRDDVDEAERDRLLGELRTFPSHFPAMRNFHLGRNESTRDDRFTHGLTVQFDKAELLHAYLSSERHEAFVRERFKPNIAERAIVSFDVG